MSPTAVTISKVRENPSTNSIVYNASFPPVHRAITTTLDTPVPSARYTVIKHEAVAHSSILIQIIKHSPGTQLALFRFTAVMAKGKEDTCLIMRQYDYERKRLRVTYSVARKDGGYQIAIDDEERAKLDGILGYSEVERGNDSTLAQDAGAFFLEWVLLDDEEQKAKDQDEWAFL